MKRFVPLLALLLAPHFAVAQPAKTDENAKQTPGLTLANRLQMRRQLDNGEFLALPVTQALSISIPFIQTTARNEEDRQLQNNIIETIGRFGAPAKAAIPRLIEIALDPNFPHHTRARAVEALGNIGPQTPQVVPTLISVLETSDENLGQWVFDALVKTRTAQPAVPAIARRLSSAFLAPQAFAALGQISTQNGVKSLAAHIQVLHRFDAAPGSAPSGEVAAAFQAIVLEGKAAQETRPLLIHIFKTRPELFVKEAALSSLKSVGPGGGADLVHTLLKTSSEWDVIGDALPVLEKIEPSDVSAVAPLSQALSDENPYVRASAARALARFGPAAAPATPALLQVLRNVKGVPMSSSVYASEVTATLNALIQIGPQARGASELTLELLDPQSRLVQNSAAKAQAPLRAVLLSALARLGVPDNAAQRQLTLRYVTEALQSNDANLFVAAARVAESLGERAKETVPLLMVALQPNFLPERTTDHNTPFFRAGYSGSTGILAALRALGAIGPSAVQALPAIQTLARQEIQPNFYPTFPVSLHNAAVEEARRAEAIIERKPLDSQTKPPSLWMLHEQLIFPPNN